VDEKKIAEADRNGFFRPAHYYLLAQRDSLIKKDIGGKSSCGTPAGHGSETQPSRPSVSIVADHHSGMAAQLMRP
jgi:hypothetical protein